MTAMSISLTGAPTAKETSWDSIAWNKAKSEVKRLQIMEWTYPIYGMRSIC